MSTVTATQNKKTQTTETGPFKVQFWLLSVRFQVIRQTKKVGVVSYICSFSFRDV